MVLLLYAFLQMVNIILCVFVETMLAAHTSIYSVAYENPRSVLIKCQRI
jgi:hypothetical protein